MPEYSYSKTGSAPSAQTNHHKHHPSLSHPNPPQLHSHQPTSSSALPKDGRYRSYGPHADSHAASHSASQRNYDTSNPQPAQPQPQTSYPPAPPAAQAGDHPWSIRPSGPLTHWSEHAQRAPGAAAPHSVLPPIARAATPSLAAEAPKAPMISRLKDKLVGGRHPLSRTWDKASFTEECKSAPASMVSMPAAADAGQTSNPEQGDGRGDAEAAQQGRRREKKTGVNRAGMAEGSFSYDLPPSPPPPLP